MHQGSNGQVERDSINGEGKTMRRVILACVVVALVGMAGCAGMSDTQQRTLTGGAAGAAGGAAIGAIAGNAGMGAAIGAGTGLLGGYLYGQHEESKRSAYEEGYRQGQASR
jgi:osmotically inducible lipoprotein OsmB